MKQFYADKHHAKVAETLANIEKLRPWGKEKVKDKLAEMKKSNAALWTKRDLDTKLSFVDGHEKKTTRLSAVLSGLVPMFPNVVRILNQGFQKGFSGRIAVHPNIEEEFRNVRGKSRITGTKGQVTALNNNALTAGAAKTVLFHKDSIERYYPKKLLKNLLYLGVNIDVLIHLTKSPDYVAKAVQEFYAENYGK